MAIGNGPEVPQTEMEKKAIFCNCAFALCEVLNLVVIFAGQTKRYKCHQHTGQAEFLRKTQLQIVDIEILRQIMAMRKNISVETGKVCVCVCMILSYDMIMSGLVASVEPLWNRYMYQATL